MILKDLCSELTEEELLELEAAEDKPVIYDEDCPEMTEEMLSQFKRMNKEDRLKQTISLLGL